jgi:DNA repair ATPase RecN
MTDNSQNVMTNNFNNLQEKNQQVLDNISQLQTQEKQLYDSLDNVKLSPEEKKQIIIKINELSQMRLNMYSTIKDMYSFYNNNVSSSATALDQSVTAINILEDELNQAKRRMNLLEDEKFNKMRLVEINTYYGKRYSAHSTLMKTIIMEN